MKYNIKQREEIKRLEYQLSGELQKAVWSVIRNNGEIKISVIARMLGRRNDSIHTTINKYLIPIGLVEKSENRLYKVSEKILGIK